MREIDRSRWREFADAFSRSHDRWLISIFVKRPEGHRQCVMRDVPFRGLTAEIGRQRDLVVITADGSRHLSRLILRPRRVLLEQTVAGVDAGVTVIDVNGVETSARFRSPMPVTAVDGIADEPV